MFTWDELTSEEQTQCKNDLRETGFTLTDTVVNLWLAGYTRAAQNLSKQLAATLRECADDVEKIKI